MAARNYPSSPPPQRRPPSSPPLSAVRSSPLASGTLRPYPVTASPFTSSPTFSFTQTSRCTSSPDLFEDFTYTADMEEDFNRIDSIPAANIRPETPQANANPPQQFSAVFPSLPRNRKTWVVFRGKVPGIYDYGWAFHWVQNDPCAHSVILANLQRFTPKGSVTLFRGLFPIGILQKPHGPPSLGMGRTPTTVEVHGWSTMGNDLGFLPKCECRRLLHVSVPNA